MKVLCGVDGSPNSFEAVRLVGRLLNPLTDQVGLYYTPPELSASLGHEVAPELLNRARQAMTEAVFQECRGYLPAGMATSLHTIIGTKPPQRGLLAAADEWHADLIAVGARGAGPVKRLLLGSVSTVVSQAAKVPVLIVRQPENKSDTVVRLNVLVAYDGSEASCDATKLINLVSWPAYTVGRVLTVTEPMFPGQVPEWLEKRTRDPEIEAMSQVWVREHESEKQQFADELAAYLQKLPTAFQQAPIVVEGDASEEILKAIDREQCDLVVMGARGLGAMERLFLGSTSQKVLSHAPCSVLVVREVQQA